MTNHMIVMYIAEHRYQIFIIMILWVVYLFTGHRKRIYKRDILSNFEQTSDQEHSDAYLQYYKRAQLLDIYRTIATIAAWFLLLYESDSGIVQGLAITTWAVVIVFQSLILSFVIYWMLAANYKIGETVRVWQLGQWEIIYIKPLYFWLAGKNNTGEHTGEFFLIPNNKVRENPIVKVDYRATAYQKIECPLYYRQEDYDIWFDEWMTQLTEFLDGYLPLRWAKNVWHIKSYIGYRYKIDLEYIDYQTTKVMICFVSKQKVGYVRKQKIIGFTEGLRTHKEQN